jgi:hypothetical protein
LLQHLLKEMPYYLRPRHENHWESAVWKRVLTLQGLGDLIFAIDFAQKFSIQVQEEPQSLYWTTKSMTILVCIVIAWEFDGRFFFLVC